MNGAADPVPLPWDEDGRGDPQLQGRIYWPGFRDARHPGNGARAAPVRPAHYAYPEDQQLGLPYSSKALRKCYTLGADRFGWSRRDPKPGSMRHHDGALMGWGMASTSYSANLRQAARANAKLHSDGSVTISTGASDQGAGTYTALALIAADELRIPVSRIRSSA